MLILSGYRRGGGLADCFRRNEDYTSCTDANCAGPYDDSDLRSHFELAKCNDSCWDAANKNFPGCWNFG